MYAQDDVIILAHVAKEMEIMNQNVPNFEALKNW